MRPLVLALVVLLGASAARADIVTGFAQGVVTRDYYAPDGGANTRPFAIGEAVFLAFSYDLSPPDPNFLMNARISFELLTETGYRRSLSTGRTSLSRGSEVNGTLSLHLSSDPLTFELSLGSSTGTLFYSRDGGAGGEGFRASVVRVADRSGFPGAVATAVPEASTVVMSGLVALAGLGYGWRRRRAA